MLSVRISLPDSLRTFVDAQVAGKGYRNVSEEEALLKALLSEELVSARLPVDHDFRAKITVRVEDIIETRGVRGFR